MVNRPKSFIPVNAPSWQTLAVGMQDKGDREIQEDRIKIGENIFVLADGVGGQPHGGRAAQIAVDSILLYSKMVDLKLFYKWRMPYLVQSMKGANSAIYKEAQKNDLYFGMCTTLTFLYLSYRKWYVGSIGDTRAYLIREGKIKQITRDHVDRLGFLTKVVGLERSVEPDIFLGEIKDEDVFVLVSDGITSKIDDKEILKIFGQTLANKEELEKRCRDLIEKAKKKSPVDNMSILTVRIFKKEKPVFQKAPRIIDRRIWRRKDKKLEIED